MLVVLCCNRLYFFIQILFIMFPWNVNSLQEVSVSNTKEELFFPFHGKLHQPLVTSYIITGSLVNSWNVLLKIKPARSVTSVLRGIRFLSDHWIQATLSMVGTWRVTLTTWDNHVILAFTGSFWTGWSKWTISMNHKKQQVDWQRKHFLCVFLHELTNVCWRPFEWHC